MGAARNKHRRWKAYSFAGTAAAIRVGKIVPVGDISLADNYREDKLEEIGLKLGLDMKSYKVIGSAAIVLNWGQMAAFMVGQPAEDFGDQSVVELPVPEDPYGANLLRKHFPKVEILAEVLLRLGSVPEADAIELLDKVPSAPPHVQSEIGPVRTEPLLDLVQEAARQLMRPPPLH
ncbi:MAG: hypothetical protein WDN29_10750 [Methylovirgula sp.]